jgi:pimeloyl-ACP methyl ester carboxylesterase
MKNLRVYGQKPYKIALLHGGPGAAGEMALVARELAPLAGVLEPLQTKATIAGQVRELYQVLKESGDPPVVLVGWSWGAWLAIIFTARHPSLVGKLILIGAGPLEESYAAGLMPTRLSRLSEADRIEALAVIEGIRDPAAPGKDKLMLRFGALMDKADSYDPLPHDDDLLEFRYDINRGVGREAGEMRKSGQLLELAGKVKCPVVVIHGDYDPHPAEGIREPLSRVLKDFKFILLEKCGHHLWAERQAKDRFYEVLKKEVV